MGSYICAVRDERKKIEEPMLAILFISALCLAAADFADYSFFVLTKIVSLILFLMICLVWGKRPIISFISWRQVGEILTPYNTDNSSRDREVLTLAFDEEGLEKTIKVSDTTPRRGISSRGRRKSYGHTRNVALEQLSLW